MCSNSKAWCQSSNLPRPCCASGRGWRSIRAIVRGARSVLGVDPQPVPIHSQGRSLAHLAQYHVSTLHLARPIHGGSPRAVRSTRACRGPVRSEPPRGLGAAAVDLAVGDDATPSRGFRSCFFGDPAGSFVVTHRGRGLRGCRCNGSLRPHCECRDLPLDPAGQHHGYWVSHDGGPKRQTSVVEAVESGRLAPRRCYGAVSGQTKSMDRRE
jgi:hypothetical protein